MVSEANERSVGIFEQARPVIPGLVLFDGERESAFSYVTIVTGRVSVMKPRTLVATGVGLMIVAALAFAASALATPSSSTARVSTKRPHVQHVSLTISDDRVFPTGGSIAIAPGVPVRVTVWNLTSEYHTITIPGLHVSAVILPAHEGSARRTVFTFTADRYGTFRWYCVFCKNGLHGRQHAMAGRIYAVINPALLP